jgi:hypothetical protein
MRFLCFTNSAIYDTQPALIPSYFDPAHRFVFFDGDIFECESADDVAKDDGGREMAKVRCIQFLLGKAALTEVWCNVCSGVKAV